MYAQGSIADNIRIGAAPVEGKGSLSGSVSGGDGGDGGEVLAAAEAAGLGPLLARLPLGLDTPVGEVRPER
jgi:ABC-type multidrug transport system fused ATPase/permease subunit